MDEGQRVTACCCYWLGLLVLLIPLLVLAQSTSSGEVEDPAAEDFDGLINQWYNTLDSVEESLLSGTHDKAEIDALFGKTWAVHESVITVRSEVQQTATAQRNLLETLGPPPGPDDLPEDSIVLAMRKQISAAAARYENQLKRCNIALTKSNQLLNNIAAATQAITRRTLQTYSGFPFTLEVFAGAFINLQERLGELSALLLQEWRKASESGQLWRNLLVLAVIISAAVSTVMLIRRQLLRRYGCDPTILQPDRRRRLLATLTELIANGLLPLLLIVLLSMVLQKFHYLPPKSANTMFALFMLAAQVIVILTVITTALAPEQPQWRLTRFSDEAARNLSRVSKWLVLATTGLIIVTILLRQDFHDEPLFSADKLMIYFSGHNHLAVAFGALALLLVAGLLLNLLRPANWRFYENSAGTETDVQQTLQPASAIISSLLMLLRLVLFASLILGVIGYLGAALYIVAGVVLALLLVTLILFLRLLLVQSLRQLTARESQAGLWLENFFNTDRASLERWLFWLILMVDALFFVTALILLLLVWGIPATVLKQFAAQLFDGVEIGGFTLSLSKVIMGLLVLVLILTISGMLKQFLIHKVLPQTRLDIGARDAISTTSGYIGATLAVIFAFIALGLDFGKMALILGGLSVGIGLGLQHLVSNFVSGLILLIQRPVKAGDWVVVGDHQGYVKHINVLSTEIETFANASVIIPNSSMISQEVLNWTYKSALGRAVVSVGASYDADAKQVRQVLLDCVKQHPEVLRRPEPWVLLQNFGDNALNFEVYFYLRKIDRGASVSSELRFAIQEAFAAAGIEIPFPQQDIHVRDINAAVTRNIT